ncbi:hypothetical protein [Lentibacter algarum]|uniref:hypothetical protein n=1 Tax=Lentibacter algarum TaxID=576131 RepID=UPI002090D2E7|nr:hypothetical protein [Lentibacter algarum]
MNQYFDNFQPRMLMAVALAGLIGEFSFELYAWLVSPLLFGVALQPANLVIALTDMFTGVKLGYGAAFVVHFTIGALGFGLFTYLVRLLMPTKTLVAGLVAGGALWFVAQGMLAPLVGRTFMMGFGTYTQSSFVGHVGMTLIMSYLISVFLSVRAPHSQANSQANSGLTAD